MKLLKEDIEYENYKKIVLRTFVDEQGNKSEFEVTGNILKFFYYN